MAQQMKKINEAKTEEELIALAKAEGIEMSEEEIKAKFAEMHQEGELEDDELDNVAGGCEEDDSYYPKIGDVVVYAPTGKTGRVKSIEEIIFFISQMTLYQVFLIQQVTMLNLMTVHLYGLRQAGLHRNIRVHG